MSYKKQLAWIKNIVWIAAFIFCIERGWALYFIIGSITLSCIVYHKILWNFIWIGGNLYADTSMNMSDKILSKLHNANVYLKERADKVRNHTEILKEMKKKEKK